MCLCDNKIQRHESFLEPFSPLGLIACQPRMQRLARHPDLLGGLRNRQTITNHGLIPLLSHAQLPHLGSVKDQPKYFQPSPEAEMSSISRGHTVREAAPQRHHPDAEEQTEEIVRQTES